LFLTKWAILQENYKISPKMPIIKGFNPVFIMAAKPERNVSNPRPKCGHIANGRQITQKVQNTPRFFNPRAILKHSLFDVFYSS
jgi:hypothetical protein